MQVKILSNLKSKYTATNLESIIYQHYCKYFMMKADTSDNFKQVYKG